VISLWDAIEFYVGGTQTRRLFSKADIDRLCSEPPTWLDPEQHDRFIQQVRPLNNAPLLTRLRTAIARDGVPVSEEEFALLARLRRVRNPAQHGKVRNIPNEEDLRRAQSVVARMLVQRLRTRR
jgi:hypothetical protein